MTAAQKAAKANFKKAIEYRKKTGVSLKEAFAHVYGKKVGAAPKKKAAKKAAPKKAAKKATGKKTIVLPTIGNILNFSGKIWGINIGVKQIKVGNEIYLQLMDETNNKPIIKIIPNLSASELDATAYDITEYIKYYTHFAYTAIEMQKLKEKLKKWVRMVSKEVNKLNKKAAPKKVAKKKHTKYGKVKAHTRRVAGVKKVSEKQVLNKIKVVKKQVNNLDKLQQKHMIGAFDKHIFSKLENVSKEIDQRENVIKSVVSRKIDLVSKNGLSWYKKFLKEAKGYVAELKKHKTELKKFI